MLVTVSQGQSMSRMLPNQPNRANEHMITGGWTEGQEKKWNKNYILKWIERMLEKKSTLGRV